MLPEEYRWIEAQFEPEGDPGLLFEIAKHLEAEGNLPGAATVYDRAFGLAPGMAPIRAARAALLDRLAVVEHGLRFRYVPGGPFLMGSLDGEPDEQPWHPVWLTPYWMTEVPISWADFCRLLGWSPPPDGRPVEEGSGRQGEFNHAAFHLNEANKLRLQYCEDETLRARDWHSHVPGQLWSRPGEAPQTAQDLFGSPQRGDAEMPWEYATKPMVAVGWEEAVELGERLSSQSVRYDLPTEAQWEKAARGGLIGGRYAWGDAPPTPECCDFGNFFGFAIKPSRRFTVNGYGLYAMTGGVWEWTRDWYDRDYYRESPAGDPTGPEKGTERVVRGGSWADCAEALAVSFRMARDSAHWRGGEWGTSRCPNIGFRLCRRTVP